VTGADGRAVYTGTLEPCEVHIVKAPAGYSYDKSAVTVTAKESEDVTLTLGKI